MPRRGMVRIVLGVVGLLIAVPLALVGAKLGYGIGQFTSMTEPDAADITVIEQGVPTPVPTGVYFAGTPQWMATCEVVGDPADAVTWVPGSFEFGYTKDGVRYVAAGELTSTSPDARATITCTGGDLALAHIREEPAQVGAAIGIGVGILSGLLALALLVSGSIGRSRSGTGQ